MSSPASVTAVLFDYGYVLSGPPDPAAWAHMREVIGLEEEAFHAAYWAPRGDYDRGAHKGADYWRAVGAHAGRELTPAQVAALLAADNRLWTQPNQPMIDWAARLQAAGTRTGILSNLGDAMTEGVLAAFPWLEGFHHRVWSYALGLAKPDPAIYRAAAEGLETSPRDILFVDDRLDNLAGAEAFGMQTIRYAGLAAFEAELAARGLDKLWHTGAMSTDPARAR